MGRKKRAKKNTINKYTKLLWILTVSFVLSTGCCVFLFLELHSLKKEKSKIFTPGKQIVSAMADLTIFNNDELSCISENLKSENAPLCPKGEGKFFLTRNYPPDTVFVGYMAEAGHHTLLQDLLRAALRMKPSPSVVVLIPQAQVQIVKKEIFAFLTPKYRKHVKFLMVPAEVTTWVQDYFETIVDGRTFQSALLDLPYFSQDGDALPSFVASICDFNLVPQADIQWSHFRYVSGDYGGNIEALSDRLVLVGNNLHEDHLQALVRQSAQKLVTVNVQWLDVGHVDEVFSVIPGVEGEGNCPSRILYASPALGWRQLAKKEPPYAQREILLNWDGRAEGEKEFDLRSCFTHNSEVPICRTLFAANLKYEEIMQSNIQLIQQAFEKHDSCGVPELTPVPVLFSPTKTSQSYGFREDEARSIDANPINNIILGHEAFIPRQSIPEFYRYTKSLFGDLRYQVRFVQGYFLHRQGGGIHCNMNIKRTCRESLELEGR